MHADIITVCQAADHLQHQLEEAATRQWLRQLLDGISMGDIEVRGTTCDICGGEWRYPSAAEFCCRDEYDERGRE